MASRVLIHAAFFVCAVLLGCAPDPWETTPPNLIAKEIATHRLAPISPVRSAHSCVGANAAGPPGWDEVLVARIHVNASGAASLQGVSGAGTHPHSSVEASCVAQLAREVSTWRYRPFQIRDDAVAREFNEEIPVLTPERWRQDNRPFPPLADLSKARIVLERGACLGSCPAYRVELRGDGGVTFEGRGHVDQVGVRRSSIDPRAFAALLQRFRDARFFALLDEYAAGITDAPPYRLTVEVDGQRARVVDYVGAHDGMPLVVSDLEREVDRVANTNQWIRARPYQ